MVCLPLESDLAIWEAEGVDGNDRQEQPSASCPSPAAAHSSAGPFRTAQPQSQATAGGNLNREKKTSASGEILCTFLVFPTHHINLKYYGIERVPVQYQHSLALLLRYADPLPMLGWERGMGRKPEKVHPQGDLL